VWTRRAVLALPVLAAACRRKPKVRIPPPIPAVLGARETGHASWYGHPYHGQRASSGEIYDMNQMTAAHLRLPFGTWVRVTNLSNGLRTDVRVNDRGPFVKNRIIDLSRAAAEQIEMIGPGTARVRLEVVGLPGTALPGHTVAHSKKPGQTTPPPTPPQPDESTGCGDDAAYGVQVGAFRELENAQSTQAKMNEAYGGARIFRQRGPRGDLYNVVVGSAADSYTANQWLARLQADNVKGFVTTTSEGVFLDCL
jgi:rare lipoprotein A